MLGIASNPGCLRPVRALHGTLRTGTILSSLVSHERQAMTTKKSKRPVGRPPVYKMPERIDASPEEIARRTLGIRPPEKWQHTKVRKRD